MTVNQQGGSDSTIQASRYEFTAVAGELAGGAVGIRAFSHALHHPVDQLDLYAFDMHFRNVITVRRPSHR